MLTEYLAELAGAPLRRVAADALGCVVDRLDNEAVANAQALIRRLQAELSIGIGARSGQSLVGVRQAVEPGRGARAGVNRDPRRARRWFIPQPKGGVAMCTQRAQTAPAPETMARQKVMRAIVQDVYDSADRLRLAQAGKPVIAAGASDTNAPRSRRRTDIRRSYRP